MKTMNDKEEISKLINESQIVSIYFNGSACGACEVIKGKIEKILAEFNKIQSIEVNGEENLDIASDYNVFSLPIFLVFVEGKETIRVGKHLNLLELKENISRYYEMIFL